MSAAWNIGPTARAAACLGLALALCSGCGRDAPPATVEGTVRLGGRPLDNCLVTFLPEPGQGTDSPHSAGLTDEHGRFRLRRADQQDGVATGWHRVTVLDRSVSTGVRRRDHGTLDVAVEESTPPPVRHSRVAPRYASATETPLRKEVKPGHQVIDVDLE